MSRLRPVFAALACLGLSACLDAEVTLDVTGPEDVTVVTDLSMARDLYDMIGGQSSDPCRNATPEVGADTVTCRTERAMTVAQLVDASSGSGRGFDPMRGLRVERVDDKTLRFTVPLENIALARPDSAELDRMAGVVRMALAGHDLTLRIRAHRIEQTNGTLSEDGTTATRAIPMVELLDGRLTGPAEFTVTARTEATCWLWVFCD